MSRAASTVLKAPSAAPYFSAQPSAAASTRPKDSSSEASSSARGSSAKNSSFCSALMHSTGVDRPTPRGSTPTTSKRARTSVGRVSAACTAASVADWPGPPGFTCSDPIRSVCPARTARTRTSCRVSPEGSS
jgi:hypothetical protein